IVEPPTTCQPTRPCTSNERTAATSWSCRAWTARRAALAPGAQDLVAQRLPRVELPELLLEVQAWTGSASDFTHVNEHGARADDLPISVCVPCSWPRPVTSASSHWSVPRYQRLPGLDWRGYSRAYIR